MCNPAEMTFGFETETIAPHALLNANPPLCIGGYRNGIQIPYLPTGWNAQSDGSVCSEPRYAVCEIASAVMKGADGIQQTIDALKIIAAKKHRVNQSCGVHVHIGWPREYPNAALERLVQICSYCETGLYAITGTKRRERGIYAKSVRQYGGCARAKTIIFQDRRHILNLENLARGRKQTVEFRCYSESIDAVKIVGWIQVCLGLVERAINGTRSPVWMAKPPTGGFKKSGTGQTEVERLISFLAWSPGQARAMGRSFGWISDAIPQDRIKDEFRRLAAKYDSQS